MNRCDKNIRDLGISTLLESFSVQVSEDGIQVKPPANVLQNPAYKDFPPFDAVLGIVEAAMPSRPFQYFSPQESLQKVSLFAPLELHFVIP